MASFQIHRDNCEKENPGMLNLKEKGAVAKQPLAVIGGKEKALAPRANLVVLNTNNNHGNVPRGNPAPPGKVGFREVAKLKVDENIGYGGAKKSNVVPVVEQFKTFSVYEDNVDTQVQAQAKVADKENIQSAGAQKLELVHQEFALQQSYDLDGTPMSVTDVLSPMSVDRSMADASNISSAQLTDSSHVEDMADLKNAADAAAATENALLPRNDRQRFFEVVQYQRDILQNFRECEKKHRPKAQYMRRQTDINHSMRTILVDWLVEVAEEYKLDTETLYLSVSYLDRFLSQMSVKRSKLQLVGTAAMYIASKYEEIYPPDVGEFVFLTDDSYTKAQVLRMENVFLKILSFNLCTPTPYVFINTYAVLCDMPEKLKYMTLYICELSLLEGESYMQYLPSLISSASLAFARHILGMQMWTAQLEEITTYTLEQLKHVVVALCKTHKSARELSTQAIREKYNRDKFKKVATIEPIELSESEIDIIVQDYKAASQCQTEQQPGNNMKPKVNLFYKF
ncbi:G2/mitotic-specific cyclin-A [Drosophila novamexicana]|uniref:G2/mitotic-specific cyclin-A n=1 Tax=Drosophila novamexicana TaxID=47314 RepID=UPI0011E58BA4|nr:G2/mitotic-specific cyclin-A [Drosophila novamexicana]